MSSHDKKMTAARGRVTQRTIAELCGVQVATVSRVLNNVTHGFSVTPEKRRQVEQVARELGYLPNPAARNLRSNRTYKIAVYGFHMFWDPDESTFTQMLKFCIDECIRRGYQVNLVFPSNPQEVLAPSACDGAVIVNVLQHTLNKDFSRYGIPYVVMNSRGDSDESFVTVDDRGGIAQAVNYLRGLGHRKIAYLGAEKLVSGLQHSSVADRHFGFLDACMAAGIEEPLTTAYAKTPIDRALDKTRLGSVNDPAAASYSEAAVDEFLEQIKLRGITAVICYNQLGGILLGNACRRKGIGIPEDLSVVAFNELYQLFEPHLTSMVFDLEGMGKRTASLLIDQIENNAAPSSHVFPLTLREGASTRRIS